MSRYSQAELGSKLAHDRTGLGRWRPQITLACADCPSGHKEPPGRCARFSTACRPASQWSHVPCGAAATQHPPFRRTSLAVTARSRPRDSAPRIDSRFIAAQELNSTYPSLTENGVFPVELLTELLMQPRVQIPDMSSKYRKNSCKASLQAAPKPARNSGAWEAGTWGSAGAK